MAARRWWMLGVTCLSVIVISLDLTVLNIALPAISAALHASTGDLQWIVDAYSLAFASVMLPAGVVGDRLGRKRLLLAGLAVFLAASVGCALSVSAGELIAARALMGLGAAIVFPLSLAVVSAAFGDDERPKAIGILTAAVAAGLPLGPVLGGLLLQHFAWNSVFWINVPAAGLTLAAGAVLVPESRNPEAPPLHVPGALLSAGSVTCLVGGVISGPERGWAAPGTWLPLAASAVLLAGFALSERRAAHRLIDPALLRDRRFTWGTAATVAVSVALFGILFTVPQYLQSVAGDDPVSAGLRLLPMMAGLLVAGGAAGLVTRIAGTRLTVAAGLALLTAGLVVLSQVRSGGGYAVVAAGLSLCRARHWPGHGRRDGPGHGGRWRRRGGGGRRGEQHAAPGRRGDRGRRARRLADGRLRACPARRPSPRCPPARPPSPARSVTQAARLASRLPDGGPALRAAAGTAFAHGMSAVMLTCAAVTALVRVSSRACGTCEDEVFARINRDRHRAGLAAAEEDRHPRPHPRQRAAAVQRAGI